jgi:subtilisin family serine protease
MVVVAVEITNISATFGSKMKGLFKANFRHSFNPKGVEDKFQRTNSLQSNLSEATAVKSGTKITSHLRKLRNLGRKSKPAPIESKTEKFTHTANSSATAVADMSKDVSSKAKSALSAIKSNFSRHPLVPRPERSFAHRTPSLHEAAKKGDLETIQDLNDQGFHLARKNDDGLTPMQVAIQHNQKETVEWLAKNGGKSQSSDAAFFASMPPEQRREWRALRTDPLPSIEGATFQNDRQRIESLSLAEIYKTYHDKGIRGQGERIAIIDTGYQPSKYHAKPEHISYFQGDKPGKSGDSNGHGTAITNMVHDALPDAHYMIMNKAKTFDKDYQKLERKLSITYINQKLSYEQYKALISFHLNHYAGSVSLSVKKGATAINLSQGLDHLTKKLDVNYNDQRLLEKLHQDKVFEPWQKALDYAKQKGVPIFLAAGNSGRYASLEPLSAVKDRSALIIVGSTDETKGVISKFSSKLHIKPDIAASGNGDLRTTGAKKWYHNIIQPSTKNASGTSFAAPDALALYGITQSARKANGLPRLSIGEFKKLLHKGHIEMPMNQAKNETYNAWVPQWAQETFSAWVPKGVQETYNAWVPQWAQETFSAWVPKGAQEINPENIAYQVGDAGTIAGRRREIVELGKQFKSS